jgi:hypothetical protein
MSTIAYILAVMVLVLVVLAKIPGLEHTVRPAIDLVFTAIKALLESSISWGIWLLKLLWGAHFDVFTHLIFSAKSIDPTVAIRENSDVKE